MLQGPYSFRDPAGVEWVAVLYRDSATRFAHEDQPGRWMLAFLQGADEGEPVCEIPAPEQIPDPPPESWLREVLERVRASRGMDEAVPA